MNKVSVEFCVLNFKTVGGWFKKKKKKKISIAFGLIGGAHKHISNKSHLLRI